MLDINISINLYTWEQTVSSSATEATQWIDMFYYCMQIHFTVPHSANDIIDARIYVQLLTNVYNKGIKQHTHIQQIHENTQFTSVLNCRLEHQTHTKPIMCNKTLSKRQTVPEISLQPHKHFYLKWVPVLQLEEAHPSGAVH